MDALFIRLKVDHGAITLIMPLFTSHLPFLYCMLCYRSGRPNSQHNVDRLLDLLANSQVISDFSTQHSGKEPAFVSDSSSEYARRNDRMGQYRRDKAWIRRDRPLDLDKICDRNESQGHKRAQRQFENTHNTPNKNSCFTKQPEDVRQMLPNRFLTVEELIETLPRKSSPQSKNRTQQRIKPLRRYTVNSGRQQGLKVVHGHHCSSCYTEIGYEILSEVTDFHGTNHTVLNFQNAYQFIATGRCVNENSPCESGGHARCTQIFRAHWTLVWAPDVGTQLVAHEVPSHCECVNVGASLATQEPMRDLKRSLPTLGLDNL